MGRPPRQLIQRFTAVACLTASLQACSVIPRADSSAQDQPPAATPARSSSAPVPSASAALLTQSRLARDAGDYGAAAASIERALRIEPNNALLWLEYGELRLAEGNLDQAETLARKAASLAGDDRSLRDAAERVLAEAERGR
jgi:Flp pilus assembly protein TadD